MYFHFQISVMQRNIDLFFSLVKKLLSFCLQTTVKTFKIKQCNDVKLKKKKTQISVTEFRSSSC